MGKKSTRRLGKYHWRKHREEQRNENAVVSIPSAEASVSFQISIPTCLVSFNMNTYRSVVGNLIPRNWVIVSSGSTLPITICKPVHHPYAANASVQFTVNIDEAMNWCAYILTI